MFIGYYDNYIMLHPPSDITTLVNSCLSVLKQLTESMVREDVRYKMHAEHTYIIVLERWKAYTNRLQGLIFVFNTTPLPVHASIGRGVVLSTNYIPCSLFVKTESQVCCNQLYIIC